jgi:predicted nucleic acid-binding protein
MESSTSESSELNGIVDQAVFDTNILIDVLAGIAEAKEELSRYRSPAISIITWIEVLAGVRDPDEEQDVRAFLDSFRLVNLAGEVSERALLIRRTGRLKLADAVIYATAEELDCRLITRNTKDFPATDARVYVPYRR